MKNKKIIIGVVIGLVVIGAIWLIVGRGSKQEVSKLDPVDTVLSFYNPWLDAAKVSETNPYKVGLAKTGILSKTLRDKLTQAEGKSDTDPVLCQTTANIELATRTVSETDTNAQILVTARDKSLTDQALVTLNKLNDGWYINDISCSLGEFAPEKEFSFENTGYLLKDHVPSPYNSKYWHIVFTENGEQGHVAPLFFSDKSMCTALDGTQSTCDTSKFMETDKVTVHGQLTERGVDVVKMEFDKE